MHIQTFGRFLYSCRKHHLYCVDPPSRVKSMVHVPIASNALQSCVLFMVVMPLC